MIDDINPKGKFKGKQRTAVLTGISILIIGLVIIHWVVNICDKKDTTKMNVGIDLLKYCTKVHKTSFYRLGPGDAYGWECSRSFNSDSRLRAYIDPYKACLEGYYDESQNIGKPDKSYVKAELADHDNIRSWKCISALKEDIESYGKN